MNHDLHDLPSSERYKLLVEAVQDYGIFMLDPAGIVVSWNKGAERIKGYRAEEILGKHFSLFYPDEARAAHWPEQELRLAVTSGKYEEEGWRIRKDGSPFWANVVITPLIDESGTLTGFAKVTRDLTERRAHEELRQQSEEAARQSEKRFRLLIDGVRDYAIYMLDPHGYIQSWNKGAELTKGYSAQEVIDQHYRMFFREEDRKEGRPDRLLQRARLHGKTDDEGWRIRKDGSAFWANSVINAIVQADGSIVGYTMVTRNMSDRAKLRELEHALQRMNEFLAVLGHELRNPLAAMRNALSLQQNEGATHAIQRMSRDVLDRQLTQLTRLLNDLLDAGRLTSGKLHIQPARVGFKGVVNDVVEAIRPAINGRSQVLEVSLPMEDVWVNADEIRLYQVLQNLLSNATKFTPEGGRILLRAAVTDGRLCVDISDNGMGMDPSTLDKIFVLFAQADAHKNVNSAGLGIGLALARSIVEMHGGKISAVSAGLGKGSTLSFELPNATLEEKSATLPGVFAAPAAARLTPP